MSDTHLPQLRRRLLSASSYFCLALVLTELTLVEAADVGLRPAFVGKAAPYQDRGFISIEGGYWFNGSESSLAFDRGDTLVSLLGPTRPGGNGWTAAIAFGRTFGPQWDWAVAYRYTSLKTSSVAGSSFTDFGPPFGGTESVSASASNRMWYQHLDLELGYRPPEWQSAGLRLFVGPRVLNARQRMQYNYSGLDNVFVPFPIDGFATFSKLGNFDHDVNLWGVGPRAGLQASVPLAQTPWSFNASGSASMIFSRVNRQTSHSTSRNKSSWSPMQSAAGPTAPARGGPCTISRAASRSATSSAMRRSCRSATRCSNGGASPPALRPPTA